MLRQRPVHDDDDQHYPAANDDTAPDHNANDLNDPATHDDYQHNPAARPDHDDTAANYHHDVHDDDQHNPAPNNDPVWWAHHDDCPDRDIDGVRNDKHRMTTKKIRVSVAIAAMNEGAQLAATIECIRASLTVPDEIVVYDDCGIYRAKVPSGVQLHRGRRRIGSGPAKHAAVSRCTGDLIIVMDGHCRPAVDWLDHILDDHRRSPHALLCPSCVGIEGGAFRATAFRGMGGKLVMGGAGFWEVVWNDCKPGIHSWPVPTVVGGCYAIPRTILKKIGGYAPAYFGYGLEEEFLGLRTWLVGGECRVVPRSVVGHWFNRTYTRETADGKKDVPWEQHFNRHVAAMVCFEDGVYERVYRPRLARYGTDPAMLALLEKRQGEIAAVRNLIKKNRVMKDKHLEEWCGVAHPIGD